MKEISCPVCLTRGALDETSYEVLHGNPSTPASDTEIEVTWACRACKRSFRYDSYGYDDQQLWGRQSETVTCPTCAAPNELNSYDVHADRVTTYYTCKGCHASVHGVRAIP
jgi:hypothetical protein